MSHSLKNQFFVFSVHCETLSELVLRECNLYVGKSTHRNKYCTGTYCEVILYVKCDQKCWENESVKIRSMFVVRMVPKNREIVKEHIMKVLFMSGIFDRQ